MNEMKIIIAGNYEQYKNYLKECNLSQEQAKYIDRPEKLRGWHWHNIEVVKTGEWWLNPCARDDYLKIIEQTRKNK